jgi:hypothetical protein
LSQGYRDLSLCFVVRGDAGQPQLDGQTVAGRQERVDRRPPRHESQQVVPDSGDLRPIGRGRRREQERGVDHEELGQRAQYGKPDVRVGRTP